MQAIERNIYLKQLISGRNNGLIKVVTGIRRCGKSFLLFNLFYDNLLSFVGALNSLMHIRNADMFDKLVKIRVSSIGTPCNPNKLSNTFKSVENIDLNPETIGFYLSHLQDAFMLEKHCVTTLKGR